MIGYRTTGLASLTLLVDLGLATLGFWAWVAVVQPDILLDSSTVLRYAFYNEVMLVGLILGFGWKPSTSDHQRRGWRQASQQSTRQVLFSLFVISLFLVALKDTIISRLVLFGYVPLLYFLLLIANFSAPRRLSRHLFRGQYQDRVVLLGRLEKTPDLAEWLGHRQALGMEVVGLVSIDEGHEPSPAPSYLGRLGDLERVVSAHRISTVVVLEYSTSQRIIRDCVGRCERLGIRLLVVGDFEKAFQHSITIFEEEGLRLIGLRREPLEDPFNRLVKRAMDVAVALPVVLLVLPPGALVIWLAQRLQSPGPVFYGQKRMGMMHRPFAILKFRTMRTDHPDHARQATRDDDRIYPFGRWLRKFSLDELPQFWNVLQGDMSVVGPRPHLPEHDELFSRVMNNYYVRTAIKPGITGLAQVTGYRGATTTEAAIQGRVRADILYLENWSLGLDLLVIIKTAGQMIVPPKTAY